MTQIVVTLEKGADSSLLQKMIENMKGVLRTSLQSSVKSQTEKDSDDWLETLHSIKKGIDPSLIDMSDDRTRYLMAK
ncbi:MAG: hypothetical protein HDQ88_00620 [Clostridia bacterium]|nr:hypothetical protein [Clostridia bacterium]